MGEHPIHLRGIALGVQHTLTTKGTKQTHIVRLRVLRASLITVPQKPKTVYYYTET